MVQLVKNPPAMQETWARSMGWEDPWRRERLPAPVFWPGEFHELYSPWGHKESDMTEQLSLSFHFTIRLRRTTAISYTMSQVIMRLTLIQEFLYSPRKIKENS